MHRRTNYCTQTLFWTPDQSKGYTGCPVLAEILNNIELCKKTYADTFSERQKRRVVLSCTSDNTGGPLLCHLERRNRCHSQTPRLCVYEAASRTYVFGVSNPIEALRNIQSPARRSKREAHHLGTKTVDESPHPLSLFLLTSSDGQPPSLRLVF